MELEEKILFVRATMKLSQLQLAKKLGVGVATINRWESGKTNPNKRDLYSFNLYCAQNNIKFEEVLPHEKS